MSPAISFQSVGRRDDRARQRPLCGKQVRQLADMVPSGPGSNAKRGRALNNRLYGRTAIRASVCTVSRDTVHGEIQRASAMRG